MANTKFTTKQKNEILKKVLRKTNQNFEEIIHVQEKGELDETLENEINNI